MSSPTACIMVFLLVHNAQSTYQAQSLQEKVREAMLIEEKASVQLDGNTL
jgi:hypothetical protein